MPEIMTVAQVAEFLQMKPRQVYELTRARTRVAHQHPLPALRIGSALRFRRCDLEKWIEQLAKEPKS